MSIETKKLKHESHLFKKYHTCDSCCKTYEVTIDICPDCGLQLIPIRALRCHINNTTNDIKRIKELKDELYNTKVTLDELTIK